MGCEKSLTLIGEIKEMLEELLREIRELELMVSELKGALGKEKYTIVPYYVWKYSGESKADTTPTWWEED